MAITQPTLGGSALPWPQHEGGYELEYEYRGGAHTMADGSVTYDLVASGMKRVITLTWINISQTDRDTVMTRLTSLGLGSATLVPPEGGSITVTLDENMSLPRWTSIGARGNTVLLYTGSVRLREV